MPAAIRPAALLLALAFWRVLLTALTVTEPTTPIIVIWAALLMKAWTAVLSVTITFVLVRPTNAPAEPVAVACAS